MEVQKLPNAQCLWLQRKHEAGHRRGGADGGCHTEERGPRVRLGREGANPKSLGCKITRLGGYGNP